MTVALPLDGVKVVDCSQIMAGPYCTMLLGDMGADVIKVEKPNGDDVRRSGPPFIGSESAAFLAINRNKRSIVLDLKDSVGVEVARSLVKDADIFVQNLRPGTMDRLGLGYEALKHLNPELVYCSISGYGGTGPSSHRSSFDLIAQGEAGLMSITGIPGGDPVKVGVPITDLNAGMYAAFGVLSAYVHRLRTGVGQHVDTSLLEAGIAYTFWESAIYFATGKAPGPAGSAHPLSAPYQAFKAADGYFTLGSPNQSNWERMCYAIGRADLLEDERFVSNADRNKHLEALLQTLEATFAEKDKAYWIEVLSAAGVPCGLIRDMAEVYADPQVVAREMAVEIEHPEVGLIRNIGIPVKLSSTPALIRRPPPGLGEHTDEVLSEHGFSNDEIMNMRRLRVVR